ncbi:MAG: class I SAM-dependent methyltransferase [Burkholderiales bacterium]|nr:class I SAM-dependent methyltransferase [Burkholderiales bacterium]
MTRLPPSSIDAIRKAFGGVSDEAWLEILVRSLDEPIIDGVVMPSFPPSETQVALQGSSGRAALEHAFRFYQEAKAYAAFCGRPLRQGRRLLDFGAGWGRIIRMFMRDLDARDLYGAEPEGENAALCRACNPYVNLLASDFVPPLMAPDEAFDYVTAFSVFSHLDEYAANRWMEEFARVLKPGGVVVFTTMPRAYIGYCEQLRTELAGSTDRSSAEMQVKASVASSFPRPAEAEEAYDRGDFLFSSTMGSPPSSHARWGWTLISPAYIAKAWSKTFHVVDYVEDGQRLDQALVVLQKRINPEL